MDEIEKSLLASTLFTGEQTQAFIERAKKKILSKGDFLLQQDQRCDFIAFVLTGSLRYFTWTDNDEFTIHFFTESNWLTDYESLISQTPSKNFLQATETTEVALLKLDDLHSLMEQFPTSRNLLKLLDPTILSSSHIQSIAQLSPDERYQLLLANHPEWVNRFPQQQIASYLGMTRETFSRVKARLK